MLGATGVRHGAGRKALDIVRSKLHRPISARGKLCESHPQVRETARSSGPGANQERVGRQSQNRQGPLSATLLGEAVTLRRCDMI